jgi:hypothetical protein
VKPSVVLLGFVFGSAAAITFGLFGVAVVFTFLKPEYPRLDGELATLWSSLGMFALLTCGAAASFYGQMRGAAWRHPAVALLLLGIGAIGWYHWPR